MVLSENRRGKSVSLLTPPWFGADVFLKLQNLKTLYFVRKRPGVFIVHYRIFAYRIKTTYTDYEMVWEKLNPFLHRHILKTSDLCGLKIPNHFVLSIFTGFYWQTIRSGNFYGPGYLRFCFCFFRKGHVKDSVFIFSRNIVGLCIIGQGECALK